MLMAEKQHGRKSTNENENGQWERGENHKGEGTETKAGQFQGENSWQRQIPLFK